MREDARVVALIVGLETYRTDAANQIETVAFARADAEAFRDLVADIFAAHRPEITLRLDEQATHATLVNDIKGLAFGLGENDLFVFYYAGHGFHDASGNRLTTWDTAPLNIEGTTLSVADDLLAHLRLSAGEKVLAFVDACATGFKPLGRRVITPLDTAEFGHLLQSAQFSASFLSCRPGEQSYPDADLGQGIWTHYLMKALGGDAPEAVGPAGFITNVSLQDYLRQEVPRHVANHPHLAGVQTPEAVVTTTNTFAIRRVVNRPDTGRPESRPNPVAAPKVVATPVPAEPEVYNGSSTAFFAERFARAFPGVREPRWFDQSDDIRRRLDRLLGAPIRFKNTTPVWWWGHGNLPIESFDHMEDRTYLMGPTELKIARMAAIPGAAYWGHCVYVEVEAMPPSGAHPIAEASIAAALEMNGYAREEYGLFDGSIPVSRAEYDDGGAEVGGDLVDLHGRVKLRERYLTPYSFLIAPHGSPVNEGRFDQRLVELLRQTREDDSGLQRLADEVNALPRRSRD